MNSPYPSNSLIFLLVTFVSQLLGWNSAAADFQFHADSVMKEKQLTTSAKGHFINQRQAISSNDQWVVFDGRNAGTDLGEVGVLGLVDLTTGEEHIIYEVQGQTSHGPGVGAAIFHPYREEITFIHGLKNADNSFPYSITRRSGMTLDLSQRDHPTPFYQDARDVSPPFTPGALRGGTHAHSYCGDGEWISFTYNDEVMEKASKENPAIQDLRTIGLMVPGKPVLVKDAGSAAEFSGEKFSLLAARVTPDPIPGSDEILRALEETWLGNHGYVNAVGERIDHALAFLGELKSTDGQIIREVFVSEIPNEMEQLFQATALGGTLISPPGVPPGIKQRRLTYTAERKYPGIQGPRQWLRASSDGAFIYAYMKDDQGIVQIMEIDSRLGNLRQVTCNGFSPDVSFALSPDGTRLVYGFRNQLYLTEVNSGKTTKIGDTPLAVRSDLRNINWAHSGSFIVYNRTVRAEKGSNLQVFRLDLP
jgi:hypothetical protein